MKNMPDEVRQVFADYPQSAAAVLGAAREVLFEVAQTADVGPLTETLRWGEPAYLTEASRAGTTIRLGLDKGVPAVFFNCQTTLVDSFRADFPEAFTYSGNRALHLKPGFDRNALALCLGRAMTYHRDKKRRRA